MKRSLRLTALALLVAAVPLTASASSGARETGASGSLALSVLPERTMMRSGAVLRTTLTVRSTGTQAATAVTACLVVPARLTIRKAVGATRTARRACFPLGDLAPGTEQARTVLLRAAASRTVNVRMSARATSTCRCSGTPTARSPVVRIVGAAPRPRVAG